MFSIKNKSDLANLERQVENLTKLVDINSIINSTLDIAKLLTIIMEIIKEIMETETSTMLLFEEKSNDLVFKVALGEAGEELTEKYRVKVGQGIAGWVAMKGMPVIVNDVYKDDRFDPDFDKNTGFITKSILCSPLHFKGKLLGVIQAINPVGKSGFDDSDQNLFSIFADQAALAVQNAIFFQNALEEERIKSELTSARSIQGSLIPSMSKRFGNLYITARSVPAREVGGEFHEVFLLDQDHIGIALGDIHEKGIPGGLRAAILNGALMAMASIKGKDPGAMVRLLSRAMEKNHNSGKNISLFYGVINNIKKTIQFVNAGIAYPILVRQGLSRYLRFGKKRLDISGSDIKKVTINFKSGDLFVIITDGILNIKNRRGKMLGLKKIMSRLEHASLNPNEIVNSLLSLADEFSDGLERREDVSIIAIKVE